MTDQYTSPEAVERLARHTEDASDDEYPYCQPIGATLRALSAERDALKAELAEAVDTANQAIDVIALVQSYKQPDDPWEENALTMCEHEVFDFDVETARAFLAHQKGADG